METIMRPTVVNAAIIFCLLYICTPYLLKVQTSPTDSIIMLDILALQIFLIYKLIKGRNWAKRSFLILSMLLTFITLKNTSVTICPVGESLELLQAIEQKHKLSLFSLFILIPILVLFFTPSAKAWFAKNNPIPIKKAKEAKKEKPIKPPIIVTSLPKRVTLAAHVLLFTLFLETLYFGIYIIAGTPLISIPLGISWLVRLYLISETYKSNNICRIAIICLEFIAVSGLVIYLKMNITHIMEVNTVRPQEFSSDSMVTVYINTRTSPLETVFINSKFIILTLLKLTAITLLLTPKARTWFKHGKETPE